MSRDEKDGGHVGATAACPRQLRGRLLQTCGRNRQTVWRRGGGFPLFFSIYQRHSPQQPFPFTPL